MGQSWPVVSSSLKVPVKHETNCQKHPEKLPSKKKNLSDTFVATKAAQPEPLSKAYNGSFVGRLWVAKKAANHSARMRTGHLVLSQNRDTPKS